MFKARKNGGLMKDGKEVEKFNNLGYRSDIPNRIKKSNEIRIFILGGSTVVYGWPPIPQAIQERFIKNNLPNVKVFNYGVVASVSGMELARTIYDVIDEKPDIIIFYNGGNDIMHPLGADPRPGYPYNFIVWENNPLLEPELDKYPGIPLFLYNSNILRTLCRNYFSNKLGKLENLRNEVLYNTESWRNKIADTYLNNASKCNKIAEAYNAKFLCFFQPMVYYKKTPTELEKSFIIKDNYNHALTLRNMILEKSHKIDPQLKFIDISNIFDNQTEQIFFDIIHTNQKGINIVADYIYNYLIKNFNITKNGISY